MCSSGHLIPCAAVQHAASGLFADAMRVVHAFAIESVTTREIDPTAGQPCHRVAASIVRVIAVAVIAHVVFAPLLEVESHARGLALIAQAARPIGVHGPRVGAALAADDDPM